MSESTKKPKRHKKDAPWNLINGDEGPDIFQYVPTNGNREVSLQRRSCENQPSNPIGLAAKNAILIVEFAKERFDDGVDAVEAAVEAAKMRCKPVLMTSFAFILGMIPLVVASGAGAEARRTIGSCVFGGMLASITVGILFVPFFFVLATWVSPRRAPKARTVDAVGDNDGA